MSTRDFRLGKNFVCMHACEDTCDVHQIQTGQGYDVRSLALSQNVQFYQTEEHMLFCPV